MPDIKNLSSDLQEKIRKVRQIEKKVPRYMAGAAEKMKDANFSAQGFVENGTVRPRWKKRSKENHLTRGRRILHGTGTLQNSVKAKALSDRITVGVDLSKVPYAKIHNEGGRVIQYVRPHVRRHWKTKKRYQVRGFARKITMPQRKFLGYSPDLIKIVKRQLDYEFKKIL